MEPDKTTKSLVVPTYTTSLRLEKLALECIESHRGKVDEIIVVEDGGRYSKKLREAADVYVYSGANRGFTKTINRGWLLASYDYTIFANSDTKLIQGNLRDICIPDWVSCPTIKEKNGGLGCYWVVPRSIKEKYGMLDERFRMFASDNDYYERIKHIFRVDERVVISHVKAASLKKQKTFKEDGVLDAARYDKVIREEYPERRLT